MHGLPNALDKVLMVGIQRNAAPKVDLRIFGLALLNAKAHKLRSYCGLIILESFLEFWSDTAIHVHLQWNGH